MGRRIRHSTPCGRAMRAVDWFLLGQVDPVWHNFEVDYRNALKDSNHDLYAFVNSIPSDEPRVGARVTFRILVAASQDSTHKLYRIALKYIPPEVGARLYEDFALIESIGLGNLLNEGEPSDAMRTARSLRDEDKHRISKANKKIAKLPRLKSRRKLREAVIQDMTSRRLQNPAVLFADWLNDMLARGAGDDFEISKLIGGKYEISNSAGDPTETVMRST